jgi:peptide/nickel transport system permease protein
VAASTIPSGVPPPNRRRPNPRLAQMKRTWYFLRRNTLAMVGLGIILAIVAVAVYALFLPFGWDQMPQYCSTNFGPQGQGSGYTGNPAHPGNFSATTESGCANYICTYEVVPPTNYQQFCGGNWYKLPSVGTGNSTVYLPGAIPPTDSLSSKTLIKPGYWPLGGLALEIGVTQPLFNLTSGMLRGTDWSLIFSVSIVGAGALIGLVVGSIAGTWGGAIDEALMRIVDIFLSIPVLLFVIVVITVFAGLAQTASATQASNTRLELLIAGFVVVWWPVYARIVRGQVLVVREQKYVEAARASGSGKGRILFRHIIPNSVYPVFIQFSLDVGTVPLLIGSLVFLGFHIFPGNTLYFPELGTISALGISDISTYLLACSTGACYIPWWQIVFPGLALFLYAISVNLLSDGLRDALDPRLRR